MDIRVVYKRLMVALKYWIFIVNIQQTSVIIIVITHFIFHYLAFHSHHNYLGKEFVHIYDLSTTLNNMTRYFVYIINKLVN